MKKLILLLCFIFLPLTILLATGTVENGSWIVPQNLNSTYYLENTYSKDSNDTYIFQIGSTYDINNCPILITQKDSNGNIANDGYSNTFYFYNKNDKTIKFSFNIYYKFYTVTKKVLESPYQNNPNFSLYNSKITLKRKENSDISYTYNYCDFYIDFQGAGYNRPSLQPGEYLADLVIIYGTYNNQILERSLQLKANYLVEAENTSTLNYSFTINPTPNSYYVNLKPDYASTSEIADISFIHSEISSTAKDYKVKNPFQVGISPNPNWNYNTVASDYYFKKVGTEGQANTGYNSIEFTPKVNITTNGEKATSPDKRLLLNATNNNPNAKVASGAWGTVSKFLNEFRLDATISITIDPAKAANLTSGQYYTTLYYFVIANT